MARSLIAGDLTIRAIKPDDPRKRLSDGDGPYLLLFVKGRPAGLPPSPEPGLVP